jgi:hypothetical protein
MYKGLMTWLCVCTTAVALAGCNNKPPPQQTPADPAGAAPADVDELAAQPHSTITDVPMPTGFELDASRSSSIAGGNTRMVDHFYEGNGDQGALVRFFRKEMPVQRWALTSQRQKPVGSKSEWIMDFVKDNERCIITVRGRANIFRNTEIAVQIYADAKIEPAGSGARR